MHPSNWTLFKESLLDLRRTWPQVLATDLVAKCVAVILVAPVAGLLRRLFLSRTSTGVLTDEAILDFLLHPIGLVALIVVMTVSLGILFAEVGQLLVIGFGATENRRVTWLDAFTYSYRHAVSLFKLAGMAVIRLLAIVIPVLAAIGVIAWRLINTHDINYYLTKKPPEFLAAAAIAGVLVVACAALVAWKIAGWLFTVPMVLFEGMSARKSMVASVKVTAVYRRRLTLLLLAWLGSTMLLFAVVTRTIGLLGRLTDFFFAGSITMLLVGLCVIIVVGFLANYVVAVFTTVMFPLYVVRLYQHLAGPGSLRPEIAPVGSLGDRVSLRLPGKTPLAAAVVCLAVVVVVSSVAIDDSEWQEPTQIIAHRGGSAVAPENTMAAFRQAVADGADWVELDVQENADGTLVVAHDRDLMRSAGSSLEIWSATNDELASVDIGSSFAPEFSDQRVPTLREVLELAKGRVGVFIELKYYGHDVNLEQKVVDLVEDLDMSSEIVIMSLNYDGVQKAAALRPDWTCGLLNAVAVGDLTRLDVDFLALTARATTLAMIRGTHSREMKTYPWTVNDSIQMWIMMSRGVDGIITDQVQMANQVKALRAQVTPAGRFIIWIAGEVGLLRGVDAASTEADA